VVSIHPSEYYLMKGNVRRKRRTNSNSDLLALLEAGSVELEGGHLGLRKET
jgi:hypothetical protein